MASRARKTGKVNFNSMPTTLRFLFLLLLGLLGLQPVAYSYAAINFVSSTEQCTYVPTTHSQASSAETAASVPLCLDRDRAGSASQANLRPTANFIAAETVTSGGTADAFQSQLLKQDLLSEQASSISTESGSLTQEAINGSKQIIGAEDLGNPAIPDGFAKFTTATVDGPSGPFTTRFYMNPQTGEIFTGLDYKTILLGPK